MAGAEGDDDGDQEEIEAPRFGGECPRHPESVGYQRDEQSVLPGKDPVEDDAGAEGTDGHRTDGVRRRYLEFHDQKGNPDDEMKPHSAIGEEEDRAAP